MDDDIFADLVGSTGLKPSSKPAQPLSPTATGAHHRPDTNERLSGPGRLSSGPLLQQDLGRVEAPSELFTNSNGTSDSKLDNVALQMTKEELEGLVKQTVEAAVDATMGKFVRSLRTVLEDMGRRIEATGARNWDPLWSHSRAW